MRILLINDSRSMRTIQKKILEELEPGIEFFEAADGLEALSMVSNTPGGFSVILVDWNMPNMDGITFIRKFRMTDKTTPLVMATTESEKPQVIEAIKAGVNNYVVKPFTPEQLIERVRQTLKKRKVAA